MWTQNQCFAHPEIKAALGLNRPENIVKVSEAFVWVIEAKPTRRQVDQAVHEAVDFYARQINEAPGRVRAILATGIAGNENSGYVAKTLVRIDGAWHPVTINGQEATGLLSPKDVRTLLEQNGSDIHEFSPPQLLFLLAAERINEYLHIGGINKNDRAKTMAALLLSVVDEPPNLDTNLAVLIGEINTRSEAVLRVNGKPDFAPFVKILPPTALTNHIKFRHALVVTIQELLNLNIRSAMDSNTDVLGQFYEVFLKYGNGAKEIGIVLTPRHITRFAVEAVGISGNDIVLDPACGTGGFLVAAFDHIRRTQPTQLDRFKKYNLFGIEQESYIAVLAIVNMIFRGDGKNNITEGNCFTTYLTAQAVDGHASATYSEKPAQSGKEPVTRVLMNPPFALKGNPDKEYRFISAALARMTDGGLLFSLLPMDALFGAHEEKTWREVDLLAKHTLLSVISLPYELFYPAALKQVVGIIVKKGSPHPREQPVFWARVARDGHLKVKAKRLLASEMRPPREEYDDILEILPELQNFVSHPLSVQVNVPLLYRTTPIDFDDPLLELVPEAYIESVTPDVLTIEQRLDAQVRENIAGLVTIDLRFGHDGVNILNAARPQILPEQPNIETALPRFEPFTLATLFELRSGHYHNLGEESSGLLPVVSCADIDNGIIGGYEVPEVYIYHHGLTIAYNGRPLTTKIHPYRFAAKDDVAVAIPRGYLSIEALIFIQATLNSERWRFSYYRKCFQAKLGRMTIKLPVREDGTLHVTFMETWVRSQPYWWFLAPRLTTWTPQKPIVVSPPSENELLF